MARYDNYLQDDKTRLTTPSPSGGAPINRNSGIGNLLLNMGDDSDSDDDDEDVPKKPTNPPSTAPGSPSKNATLAAAVSSTAGAARSGPAPSPPQQQQQPPQPPQMRQIPPQQQMRGPAPPPPNQPQQRPMMGPGHPQGPPPSPGAPGPQPIAAPRPGYAAPIATLNLARPEAVAGGPGSPGAQSRVQNPFEPPYAQVINMPRPSFTSSSPASPSPSMQSMSSAPHPLLPSVTPIMPVFIRPKSKSPAPDAEMGGQNVKFAEGATPRPRKVIMRGNSEETLLPSRGEKGDDFWRRFSIVAKEESKKPSAARESSWLRKTQSGTNRLSRWVWVIGVFLLLIIAGGIGIGIFLSRNAPSHQQPTAIGGSADNLASSGPTTTTAKTVSGKTITSSSLHVSPTNTVARREDEIFPTPVPAPSVVPAVRRHLNRRSSSNEVW